MSYKNIRFFVYLMHISLFAIEKVVFQKNPNWNAERGTSIIWRHFKVNKEQRTVTLDDVILRVCARMSQSSVSYSA